MTNVTRVFASALILATAMTGGAMAQTSTLDFIAPGSGPWGVAANWDPVFIPGDNFPAEIAGISNDGTVTLSAAAPFPVNGVVLGESGHPIAVPVGIGTMIISAGGSLDIIATASGDGTVPAAGTVRVGAAGTGNLQMTGGVLNVSNALTVAGAADSSFSLSGNASLSVGSANLQRTTRIRGPNVSFESAGPVNIGGTFVAEITGAAHSIIDAFGSSAAIGGTLRAEFSGFTPAVGNSWNLLQAGSVNGNFQNIQVAGVTPVPGGKFESVNTGTNLRLDYTNALTLAVDRRTGQAQIINHIGSIGYDGYSIGDASGGLNPATWSSLDDQGTAGNAWREANPTNSRLNELNPTGATTLAAGNFNLLGNILKPPTQFGQADPSGITFDYHLPGGRTVSGIVDVTGLYNNLVLLVDPATGQAAIQNQSPFAVKLDGYTVSSASGSLRIAQWSSFDDQNTAGGTFLEANPTTTHLSELNPASDLLLSATSTALLIGSPFNPVGTRDLSFTFHLAGGGGGPLGDTNGDGTVNLPDLNNVRNNFGATGLGDTDGDNDVDLTDLNNVRNNFGATGGGGGPGGTFAGIVTYGAIPGGIINPVPEPSTLLLALAALVTLGGIRGRRKLAMAR